LCSLGRAFQDVPVSQPAPPAYTARFRFGRSTITVMVLGILAGIVAILLDLSGAFGLVAVTASFTVSATVAALFGWPILRGAPGLRIDSDGILLGGRPPYEGRTRRFVPWSDIAEIYLFRLYPFRTAHGPLVTSYIGLLGPAGARPLSPLIPRAIAHRSAQRLVLRLAHVPLDAVLSSRPAFGWQLEPAAVVAAVERFAPQVPVVLDLNSVTTQQKPLR